MQTFIADEYSVQLPDGTEVHRYDPKTKKHTVATRLRLYAKGALVYELSMDDVDPEARLLIWAMAANQVFGEENKRTSSELWDRVPIDFPPRMHTLSPGYDGLHGPFGRGLDRIRKNPPSWFKFRKNVHEKTLHWLELPVQPREGVTLWAESSDQSAPSSREIVVTYLRELADRIENNDRNAEAVMTTKTELRPLRPWYEAGEVKPQGFEYAGPHTISLEIVLPRRVGERVSSDT